MSAWTRSKFDTVPILPGASTDASRKTKTSGWLSRLCWKRMVSFIIDSQLSSLLSSAHNSGSSRSSAPIDSKVGLMDVAR